MVIFRNTTDWFLVALGVMLLVIIGTLIYCNYFVAGLFLDWVGAPADNRLYPQIVLSIIFSALVVFAGEHFVW